MTRQEVSTRLQAELDEWSRIGHPTDNVTIDDIDKLEQMLDDEAEACADIVMGES